VGNRRPPHACAPTGHASRSPWQRRGMATSWETGAPKRVRPNGARFSQPMATPWETGAPKRVRPNGARFSQPMATSWDGNVVGNRRPPHACAPTGHASRSPWQRRGMATPWDGNAGGWQRRGMATPGDGTSVRFTGEQAPRDLTEAVNPTQRDLGAEGRPRHITRQTAWNRQLSPAQRGGFCNVLIKRLFVLKSWTGSSFGVAS